MRFEGQELTAILRNQVKSVLFCDAAGVPIDRDPNPRESLKEYAAELGRLPEEIGLQPGFFGIGNRKRVRYVQAKNPSVWGAGWKGGSHTTQGVRNDQNAIIPNVVKHKDENVSRGNPDPTWMGEPVRRGATDVGLGKIFRPDPKPWPIAPCERAPLKRYPALP
jgi:hypothetical protein